MTARKTMPDGYRLQTTWNQKSWRFVYPNDYASPPYRYRRQALDAANIMARQMVPLEKTPPSKKPKWRDAE